MVPGVSSKDIQVNIRSNHSEPAHTASSEEVSNPHSQNYAMANTWTPEKSSQDPLPAFDFTEKPESSPFNGKTLYHGNALKSSWKKKKTPTWGHSKHPHHVHKSAPQVAWASPLMSQSSVPQKGSSSIDTKQTPTDPVLDDVASLEGGMPFENDLDLPREESTLFSEETLESFVVNPFQEQMYEPNAAIEQVISEEDAYSRYLQLPWEKEAWLNERVESSLRYDQDRLNANVWMMYLCIGGMVFAVSLALAFKLNPTLAEALARFRAGLTLNAPKRKTDIEVPMEDASPYSDEEKPFASWLMPHKEDLQESLIKTEPQPSLADLDTDDDDALVPLDVAQPQRNRVFVIPQLATPSRPASPDVSDAAIEVETKVRVSIQERELSKIGRLKAPTYFAFRHHQKSRQDTPAKAPMKALFALPKTPVKQLSSAKALAYSRLNRLHFG